MCEKAGTVARTGAGDAAWLGAVVLAVVAAPTAVAAGAAVGFGTRLASWAWWSSKSRLDSAASGRARLVEVAGTWPSTRGVGGGRKVAAPTPANAGWRDREPLTPASP